MLGNKSNKYQFIKGLTAQSEPPPTHNEVAHSKLSSDILKLLRNEELIKTYNICNDQHDKLPPWLDINNVELVTPHGFFGTILPREGTLKRWCPWKLTLLEATLQSAT